MALSENLVPACLSKMENQNLDELSWCQANFLADWLDPNMGSQHGDSAIYGTIRKWEV